VNGVGDITVIRSQSNGPERAPGLSRGMRTQSACIAARHNSSLPRSYTRLGSFLRRSSRWLHRELVCNRYKLMGRQKLLKTASAASFICLCRFDNQLSQPIEIRTRTSCMQDHANA
jgi:hypothetical protein